MSTTRPFADAVLDHRRAPLEGLAALEIAAEQDVADVFRVAGDDVAVEARVGDAGLEGRRVGEVDRFVRAQTPTQRVAGVDLDPERRSGADEVLGVGHDVVDRQLEEIDEVVRTRSRARRRCRRPRPTS